MDFWQKKFHSSCTLGRFVLAQIGTGATHFSFALPRYSPQSPNRKSWFGFAVSSTEKETCVFYAGTTAFHWWENVTRWDREQDALYK
jgi:hypothetical protein